MDVSVDFPTTTRKIDEKTFSVPVGELLSFGIELSSSSHERIDLLVNGDIVQSETLTDHQRKWETGFTAKTEGKYKIEIVVHGNLTREPEFEHLQELKEQENLEIQHESEINALELQIVAERTSELVSKFQSLKSFVSDVALIAFVISIIRKLRHRILSQINSPESDRDIESENEYETTTLDDFDRDKE